MPDVGQPTLRKFVRYAVRLPAYDYVCFIIRGDDNVLADLCKRWTIPLGIFRLVIIAPQPTMVVNFDWPTVESITASQRLHLDSRPDGFSRTNDVFRSANGAI